jgi:hypothetical protein
MTSIEVVWIYIDLILLVTIIHNEKDARTMNKYRTISLLNCSYKIFNKALTNKIGKVIDRLVDSNQTAFIKGWFILESVVTPHEVVHSVHQSRKQGVVLKLDYEKAYDKVCWEFLLDILEERVWEKWIKWIKRILCRAHCKQCWRGVFSNRQRSASLAI